MSDEVKDEQESGAQEGGSQEGGALTPDGYFLPTGAVRGVPYGNLAAFAHPRDVKIAFRDDDHRYFIMGRWQQETMDLSRHIISVTRVIGLFENEFDAPRVAHNKVAKDGRKLLSDPKYKKLLAKLPQDKWAQAMQDQWAQDGEESRELGKRMHACLEDHLNGDPLRYQPTEQHTHMLAFLAEAKPRWGYVPVRAEWFLFASQFPDVPSSSLRGPVPAEQFHLAGSADLVLAPESEVLAGKIVHLMIGDWKRAKSIEVMSPWNKMKHELGAFWDTNFCTYTLQLNIYQWILENFYGFIVSGRVKIAAHPLEVEQPLVQCVDDQQAAVHLMLRRRLSLLPE